MQPRSEPRSGGRGGVRRWGLHALGLAVLFLVAVEVLCRVLYPARPPLRFSQDVEVLMGVGQERFADVLEGDPELFWRLVADVVLPEESGRYAGRLSNAQRLREDHGIAVPKPEGEVRVLFLGSSPTFGTGVRLEETFVEIAERRLRERLPDRRVECINAGVPGYSLFQGWRYLETEGLRFEPDLIVVQFGASGLQVWDNKSDVRHHAESLARRPPRLLRWSRLASLVWGRRSAGGPPTTPGVPRPRLDGSEFRALLADVKRAANRHGAELLFVVWPSRVHVLRREGERRTPLHELMLRFAKNHGIGAVELLPVFEELCRENPVEAVYLDAWHATALANAAVGERLADEIARRLEL